MWRERHVISAHDRYPSHHKMATAGRSGTGQGCRIGAITVRTFGGESVYHLVFCGLYADESAWASGDAAMYAVPNWGALCDDGVSFG